jgi:outer membrane receptor protein involved in Fe transport
VAVGARNVLNREPPKDYGSAYGYDPSLYDGRGRSYWLRVARSF